MSLEISEIFKQVFRAGFERILSPDKVRVVRSILSCRTAAAGVHLRSCAECGNRELAFNSCANRHCPKCQGRKSSQWVEARCKELLPVGYYHLVFTLPSELRLLCLQNKRLLYDALLKSSAETIQDAIQFKRGVRAGGFAVLHTWNQELSFHPHAHHVVPACGFDASGMPVRLPNGEKFLVSTKVLSPLFKGKFIFLLKQLYCSGSLHLKGQLEYLQDERNFELYLRKASKSQWVVYAKRPFSSPEAVIKYLASYIHRVGISSRRLLTLDQHKVTFLARCRKDRSKKRPFSLTPKEFCRRFLQHVLPKGFKRIRYYGFLRNNGKQENLHLLRTAIGKHSTPIAPSPTATCKNCHSTQISFHRVIKTHYSHHSAQSRSPTHHNSS